MKNGLNKEIILWIINLVLMFLIIIISLGVVCAAVYFPLVWIGFNSAKGVTILIGILYMVIIIIKLIAEAME